MRKLSRRTKAICFTLIVLISVIFTAWGNTAVETGTYIISSDKIPAAFSGFRIAQVSDLHAGDSDRYNKKILRALSESEPDIIVITGDLIDSFKPHVDSAIVFSKEAVQIAPVYYINGNHESGLPEAYANLKQSLTGMGIIFLENTSVNISENGATISLTGINDPSFPMSIVSDSAAENISHQITTAIPETDGFKILLAHRPEYFNVYAGKADLVFSGHAHGGQFIIPFIGGLIAPGQGLFPQFTEGIYTKDNTNMIVSRGLGNSIIPFRINNRPEIVIAELASKSK